MRISDWSSDVCSSDLAFSLGLHDLGRKPLRDFRIDPFVAVLAEQVGVDFAAGRNITVLANENGDRVRRFHCLAGDNPADRVRSEEHTSELQSLMRISYAVFCLKKKTNQPQHTPMSIMISK